MTDTPRRRDRLTAESDPAFEALAAYLETGSLRDAYRQGSGNEGSAQIAVEIQHKDPFLSAPRHDRVSRGRQNDRSDSEKSSPQKSE